VVKAMVSGVDNEALGDLLAELIGDAIEAAIEPLLKRNAELIARLDALEEQVTRP
jgi:hypothetical protein